MTRSEAIALIEKSLLSADEATLKAAAEFFLAAGSDPSVLPRELTAREFALIEQSKEDFKAGRTYAITEARTYIDEPWLAAVSSEPKHEFESGKALEDFQ